MRLFDLTQPVWQKIGRIGDVILLSFLWILCSLPIVTIGAANVALHRKVIDVMELSTENLVRSFFEEFKKAIKKTIGIWIICILLGVILFVEMMFFGTADGAMTEIAKVLVLVFANALLVFIKCIFLNIAVHEWKTRELIENTIYYMLRYIPVYTMLVIGELLVMFVVIYDLTVFLVFLPGLFSWLECKVFRKIG